MARNTVSAVMQAPMPTAMAAIIKPVSTILRLRLRRSRDENSSETSVSCALTHAARVANAGGIDAAFRAGHSTAACPSNITTTAPIRA